MRSGLTGPPVFPCKENICAVVVTYFPGEGLSDRVLRAKEQVGHAVIVDNATSGEALERVQAATCLPGIDWIQNPANLGIATALNQGVEWARQHGYKWALLLDDDTVPGPEMVATLIRAFEEFPDRNRLAIIGTNRILNPGNEQLSLNRWWTIGDTVITSGSLLELSAAQRIGPFRDEFFMDFVDFEYCLRARSMGFQIVEILIPTMQHFIGDRKTVRRLGLTIFEFNHRPWRSYYKIRNFMFVAREYLFKDPRWVFRMSWGMAKVSVVAALIEDSRIPKLRYTLLGFYDGLLGRVTRRVV